MADEESKLDLDGGSEWVKRRGEPVRGLTAEEWADLPRGKLSTQGTPPFLSWAQDLFTPSKPMTGGTARRERERRYGAETRLGDLSRAGIDDRLRLISEGAAANEFKYLTPEEQREYGELTTSSLEGYGPSPGDLASYTPGPPPGSPVVEGLTGKLVNLDYPGVRQSTYAPDYGPMQSYESEAIIQARDDRAKGKKTTGTGGGVASVASEAGKAISKPVTNADLMHRVLNEMLSGSDGPTPHDVEKTHRALYGPSSAIAVSQKNINMLSDEAIEISKRQARIDLAARAEEQKLMAIDKVELEVQEQIYGDFAEMTEEQYGKFREASDAVDVYINSQRQKWENEDPISAFRMFDWFKKEKNEAGDWEDSFQWSGFATSIASLAAVAGNVFLNMATDGKVPLFAVNLLTTAMNNDLSAQKAQVASEGKRANLFGIMLDAYNNEALALNHYQEMQFKNAASYFKRRRAEVQTSDPATARGLANLENMALMKANELKMAKQTNMQEYAKSMAQVDVSRLTQAGAAAQRISVKRLQELNGLSMAAAADARKATNPDGDWDNAIFETKLIKKKADLAKKVNETQRLAKSFIKRFGDVGALYQFWGIDVQDVLGRLGTDDAKRLALTPLKDNARDLAQSVAKTKDVGNLSVQEQEWWFEMGPDLANQPLGVVLTKIATLAHSSRLEAIDMWSIANNENRQKYSSTYMAAFGLASPQEMNEVVARNRQSFREGGIPFTNLDLRGYPQDMQIDMETALGGRIQATINQTEMKGAGPGISYREVSQEAAPLAIPTAAGISKELELEVRPDEGIKGAPEGGYAYLPTDQRDDEGNIIKSRHSKDAATAIGRMSTFVSRVTKGAINIRTSGAKTGIRTSDEMANLKKQYENWLADDKGEDKPWPKVSSNKHAPVEYGGHAQIGKRKEGMHEAVDFTVRDSKNSPEYMALIEFGPYFGIYPAHKTDIEHPHWHHFEFNPSKIRGGVPKGHLPGYGSPRPKRGSAETTVSPGSVAALKPGIASPKFEAFQQATSKPLAPYQKDPEAIRNLLQHQQSFARGRGLAPKPPALRSTPAWPAPPPPPPEIYGRPAPAPAWPKPPPPPNRVPPVYGRQADPTLERYRGLKGLPSQLPRTLGPWGK